MALAEQKADELTALAGDADRAFAAARIERLDVLRRQIRDQQRRIETAYAEWRRRWPSAHSGWPKSRVMPTSAPLRGPRESAGRSR